MPPTEVSPDPVVISLVLRLAEDAVARQAVLAALRKHGGIEAGEQRDCWLPVVAETAQPQELHAWLESLPGVMFVDVTFVEVATEAEAQPCSGDFSQEPNLK
ncbi:MAG: hypothetical protein IPP19_16755 [Verrucomicrobia bacterium]|nr:hypothetical protein [Verrucomicrobiota bacterium]